MSTCWLHFFFFFLFFLFFFFQAEAGIRYLVRSRGLGDVYKRQRHAGRRELSEAFGSTAAEREGGLAGRQVHDAHMLLSLIHI